MAAVSYERFEREVLEYYELKARATWVKVRQAVREVKEVPGVRSTSDLKPVILARWLKRQAHRSPATRDSLLRSFRSACSFAVASGYLKASPFALKTRWVDLDRADDCEEPAHHSIDQIRRVLELASAEAGVLPLEWKPRRLEALIYTFAFTALRKNEALRLRKRDVDLGARVIRIRRNGRALKTLKSAAPVPIAEPLALVLERWLPETGCEWAFPGARRTGPWTGGPPGHKPLDQVKALGLRAGVPGLTILSFRHSFATHARSWGLGELMLKAILRHTTTRTQRHYLHADLADLRGAVAGVTYGSQLMS